VNIFVLDPDPQKAALAHCDEHLHKMILESAQMLSTAAHIHFPHLAPYIYAPAYQTHPCTVWTCANFNHMVWLCSLADTLECLRESKGCNRHSSMDVIKAIYDCLPGYAPVVQEFAEAMYPHIKIRQDLSTVQKYQLYYRKKHTQWALDKGRGMTYKDRPAPNFMKDLIIS
jgi:hypothetical protein